MKPANEELDFVIENYVQRLEAQAALGRARGLSPRDIKRSADLYSSAVLVPVCGPAIQKLGTSGFEPDGFMLQVGSFQFASRQDLKGVVVTGWLPAQHGKDVTVTVSCEERRFSRRFLAGAIFSLELPLEIPKDTDHQLRITLSDSYQPAAVEQSSTDSRNLGCILLSVEFS